MNTLTSKLKAIAHSREPWELPSVPLNDRHLLPNLTGIYFAYQGKAVLYVGMTDRGFRTRWQGHHKLPELQGYQQASKKPVSIGYWVIGDSTIIGLIEDYLISLWQPKYNRTGILRLPQTPSSAAIAAKKEGFTETEIRAILQYAHKAWVRGIWQGSCITAGILTILSVIGYTSVFTYQSAQQQQQQEVYR